jgi:hypothetical protein
VPHVLHRPARCAGSSGAFLLVLHEVDASTATVWAAWLIFVLNGFYLLACRLFPQDSADRLAWWEAVWSRRERAQNGRPGRATGSGNPTERPEGRRIRGSSIRNGQRAKSANRSRSVRLHR